jgi:hypothetical protein
VQKLFFYLCVLCAWSGLLMHYFSLATPVEALRNPTNAWMLGFVPQTPDALYHVRLIAYDIKLGHWTLGIVKK